MIELHGAPFVVHCFWHLSTEFPWFCSMLQSYVVNSFHIVWETNRDSPFLYCSNRTKARQRVFVQWIREHWILALRHDLFIHVIHCFLALMQTESNGFLMCSYVFCVCFLQITIHWLTTRPQDATSLCLAVWVSTISMPLGSSWNLVEHCNYGLVLGLQFR